jgi:hypothetical protein
MGTASEWQDLQQNYLTFLRRRSPTEQGHWFAVWSRFIEHPYYQDKARQVAHATLCGLNVTAPGEKYLLADTMLLLARRIQQPSDAATIRRVSHDFPGWLKSVLIEDCQMALALLRDVRHSGCGEQVDACELDETHVRMHEFIAARRSSAACCCCIRLAASRAKLLVNLISHRVEPDPRRGGGVAGDAASR